MQPVQPRLSPRILIIVSALDFAGIATGFFMSYVLHHTFFEPVTFVVSALPFFMMAGFVLIWTLRNSSGQ